MDESTKGATGKCVLPAFASSRPTAAQSYAIAGDKMKIGFEALSAASGDVQWAASFLAAQSVECLLKSFLSTKGFGNPPEK